MPSALGPGRGAALGLLQALRQAKDVVAPFSPLDRVAVLTYESHLRLHLDFTSAGRGGTVLTRTRYVD